MFNFLCVLCFASIFLSYFLSDNIKPTIEIINKPTLACGVTYDELLDNATTEDENLKSFFIEEKDLLKIADTKKITYVAIDQSNNVSKKSIDIDVDDDITTYHIETLKPLNVQVKQKFISSDYFTLKNGCGWDIDDYFTVEGADFNKIGSYDIRVKVKKHPETDILQTTVEVDDYLSPKIVLINNQVINKSERYYTDEYFLEQIDHVEDDEDNTDDLLTNVTCNWKEVLLPTDSGYVDKIGTYTITYHVIDSKGNTGKATLRVILEKPEPAVVISPPVQDAEQGE